MLRFVLPLLLLLSPLCSLSGKGYHGIPSTPPQKRSLGMHPTQQKKKKVLKDISVAKEEPSEKNLPVPEPVQPAPAPAPDLKPITPPAFFADEDFPPFSFRDADGRPTGIAIDLILQVAARMHPPRKVELQLVPWKKGYEAVQAPEGAVLFFPLARTPEREPRFRWVGPLADLETLILAPAKAPLVIRRPEELLLHSFAVLKGSVEKKLLLTHKVPEKQIYTHEAFSAMVNQLSAGKVDLIACDRFVALWSMKQMGITREKLQRVYGFGGFHYAGAFSRGTDDACVKAWQEAFEELCAEPNTVQDIFERYGCSTMLW